ncbi:DUF2721 domain-containing protein [Tahibacter amnicola]|uniref:DUF2721 domain-containing protein n=1 Tax=Tahibacter amnicola TaxID=2976241 RepID=A0ABY6BMM7_9GAMM|nr:DUF2721 domain-containing protein [Tahibacter amnicola]UXI69072.1 DUF2721 domain-containing protein [Tahibacter amnicola]
MADILPVNDIAHVIQLSVAPVFLLSGVGALLGVLTSRLARVVDRARRQEDRLENAAPPRDAEILDELAKLSRRARLMNWSISLVTACALLISSVIVVLFAGALLRVNVSLLAATLFVTAMIALIAGLVAFLREIYLATIHLRLGPIPVGKRAG